MKKKIIIKKNKNKNKKNKNKNFPPLLDMLHIQRKIFKLNVVSITEINQE